MKKILPYIHLATKMLIVIFIIILFNIDQGCKDPGEYEPEVDSLIEPPEPVELVYPPDDTGFILTNIYPSMDIQFIWQAIIDAEYYEFHISIDPAFNDSFTDVYTQAYNTIAITKDTTDFLWDYYWRVRASSGPSAP